MDTWPRACRSRTTMADSIHTSPRKQGTNLMAAPITSTSTERGSTRAALVHLGWSYRHLRRAGGSGSLLDASGARHRERDPDNAHSGSLARSLGASSTRGSRRGRSPGRSIGRRSRLRELLPRTRFTCGMMFGPWQDLLRIGNQVSDVRRGARGAPVIRVAAGSSSSGGRNTSPSHRSPPPFVRP